MKATELKEKNVAELNEELIKPASRTIQPTYAA